MLFAARSASSSDTAAVTTVRNAAISTLELLVAGLIVVVAAVKAPQTPI